MTRDEVVVQDKQEVAESFGFDLPPLAWHGFTRKRATTDAVHIGQS